MAMSWHEIKPINRAAISRLLILKIKQTNSNKKMPTPPLDKEHKTVVNGMAIGATIGCFGGPVGAIIGAGIGSLVGTIVAAPDVISLKNMRVLMI